MLALQAAASSASPVLLDARSSNVGTACSANADSRKALSVAADARAGQHACALGCAHRLGRDGLLHEVRALHHVRERARSVNTESRRRAYRLQAAARSPARQHIFDRLKKTGRTSAE
eukprot:6203004-Pleurochrysis_carterae.AAC.1